MLSTHRYRSLRIRVSHWIQFQQTVVSTSFIRCQHADAAEMLIRQTFAWRLDSLHILQLLLAPHWGLWGLHEGGEETAGCILAELPFACLGQDRSAKPLADDRLSRTVVTKGCSRPLSAVVCVVLRLLLESLVLLLHLTIVWFHRINILS